MAIGPAWASGTSIFSESLRAFLSPVSQFLDDTSVTEILINGPDEVWIEREGKLTRTSERFTEDGLLAAARNMAQFVGRPLDEHNPRLDARLPDGSRIHVILPPLARCGTVVSIRKFYPGGLTIEDLVDNQSLTEEAARFLEVLVLGKKNMIVAGGTGSGKTTLLNMLSHFIPDEERILTIEDSAELQLDQEHLVPLESRPPDPKGKNAVNIRDLLHSALRLRPDRMIIGEVRGGECFDLLQAMNTGHDGTMSTVHANGPVETLSRLESLALLAETGLPLRALRAQIASAIHIVVCTARLRDGARRLTAISEVLPLDERGDYRVQDLFIFTQTRLDDTGRVQGYLSPTGLIPTFESKLVADGFDDMVESFFQPETHGYDPPRYFNGAGTQRLASPSTTVSPAPQPAAPRASAPEARTPAGSTGPSTSKRKQPRSTDTQTDAAPSFEGDNAAQSGERTLDTEPRLDIAAMERSESE